MISSINSSKPLLCHLLYETMLFGVFIEGLGFLGCFAETAIW